MREFVVFKAPLIMEGPREDGTVRYFCENCQSVTDWTQQPTKHTESVCHNCKLDGFVLHKMHGGMERREDGSMRFLCEHCGDWTDWNEMPKTGFTTVTHFCRPSSENARQLVNSIAPTRCNSGMLADAEMLLLMVSKKESTTPELKALAEQKLEGFDKLRRLAAVEQLKNSVAITHTG